MKTLPEKIADLSEDMINEMKACMKKPIEVKAVKLTTEFRVESMEGDHKKGKPGDYLMCGVDGELYICDGHIFEKTYSWVY